VILAPSSSFEGKVDTCSIADCHPSCRSLDQAASEFYTFSEAASENSGRKVAGHTLLQIEPSLKSAADSQSPSGNISNFLTVPSSLATSGIPESGMTGVDNAKASGVTAGRCFAPTKEHRLGLARTLSFIFDRFFELSAEYLDRAFASGPGQRDPSISTKAPSSTSEGTSDPWTPESSLVFQITYLGQQADEQAGPITISLADVRFHGRDGGNEGQNFHFLERELKFHVEVEGARVPHETGICGGLDWIPERHYALTAIYHQLRFFPKTSVESHRSMFACFRYCELIITERQQGRTVYTVTCFPASQAEGIARIENPKTVHDGKKEPTRKQLRDQERFQKLRQARRERRGGRSR
jgi:hypothetical protein